MKHTLKSIFSLLLVLSMLCGMIVLPVSAEETGTAEFVVLSTTDMHGRCWDTNILNDTSMTNSMLNVATAVSQMRATYGENVVLIDNGDTYQGTPVSSLQITEYTQGLTTDPNPMAISLKYIGYDMAGLGNHEFNYAWSTMSASYAYLMTEEEGMSTLPTVCANLYYDGTDGVHAAGENVMTPYITTTVKDSNGADVKIAILGFDTPDCTRWDIPDNYPGMRFSHPDNPNLSIAWEAEKWLAVIEEKEAPDFVIVAFHSGLGSYTAQENLVYGTNTENQVLSMIQDTTGIDMVIAGHDHSESYSNNTYKNANGEEVLVVNGGGNSLTTSVFTIAADGTISLKSSVNNKLSNYAADTTLKSMLKKYADAASEYVNSTAGTAIGTWDKETNFYLKQSDTIDLIGRAQIAQGTVHLAEKYDTAEKLAALYEATGLDHLTVDVSSTSVVVNGTYTVSAGDLSMKDIYRMYRYDNSLYLLPVTGQEIKDILEFNAATHLSVSTASGTPVFGTKGDNFTNPIFYGLDFQYDMSREEYDRVINLKFADGREVEADKTYIIAINNYHLGNASGPFSGYSTDDAIWSQTDDMGGGFVQDLISEYLAAQTEENGGVSPEPSNWSLVYTAEVVIGEAEGTYIGSLVDPNTLESGDKVLIYYPASNTFISNVASGSRLAPSEDVSTGETDGVSQAGTDDATAVFTVEKHDDGSVSFLDADGKYMTSGSSGNAMTMEETLTDCAKWTFVATDNGWYVHNEGANYMGNYNQYLEYYYGFTTYGLGSGGALYTFNFYKVEEKTVPTINTQIAATSKNMTKYGHLDLDIPADTFLETFAYGDIVTVTFTVNGTELSYDFPVCSNYDDVDTYAYLIRAVSGKDTVTMAINYGKIGVVSGVIVTDEVNGGYKVAEGVTLPIPATVTMKEAGGYAKELEIRALNRTNNREDYPELTDKEFANFRVVTTTGMGDGILYRSSSPINPSLGRNTYADAAAKAAGVKTFINLADSEAEATAYEGYADSYYSAQNHIFLGLPVAFASDEFKSGLAEGFRYIATHEGPYLVHCTEGKDRAGLTTAILECFMGATAEEVCADYVKTFRNYYNVVDGVQTDLTDEQVAYLENAIMNNLGLIFGIEDAKNADLAAEAAKFMSAIGLTDAEIAQLKANLSVDVPVTLTAYLDEDGKNMFKYGQLDVEISVDEFLQTFDYGDIVDVTFNGVTYEGMPVCTNYTDVSAFELLVRAAPGYNIVTLAIQYGQIGIDSGIIVATDKGYEIAEGIEFPIEVTFTLREKGGYAETLNLLRMTRTNNREDYPELTDEQFANFRVVTTTGMGEGILYRSSNPVNPQIGRNTYADAAAAKAGVKTFMNLADTQAEAEAYAGYSDSYYSKQNVIFLGLPAAFTSEEFKAGLANGFRFLATHEGPYLVHCTEGKDRAGLTSAILECFMGATWEEVAEDYLTTYHNYYSVIDGVQTPLTEAQENYLRNEILKYLGIIFEVEDVTAEGVDLQAEAEVYLAYIGLTEEEIAQLKANLSVDVEDTTVTIEVFETTDIHGYLLDTSSGDEATFQYRMAYIANIINEARANAENDGVILLDSGDIYQGTPVSNLTFGNALRAAMDYMGYDAVSLGNHEFDWDVTTYAADKDGTMPAYEIGEYKGDSDIPVLAYDLIDNATGKKADFVKEYTILDKGGVKVAVIGYIPDYSMDIMAAKINPYTIDENLEGLSAKVDEVIAAENPDVVIVLAHASPKYIAETLDPEKVDLVLGGHSHQVAYGVADSGVTYMQGNCQAQGYANAKIVVDTATGEVTVENPTYVKITGDKTALFDTEENAAHLDSDIVAISKASWDAVKDTMQEVLGEVDQSIYRRQYIGDSTNTIAGNWLTGIMLRATADQNTIIAFTNSGGIRCDLLKDEDAETRAITVGDIYTISPFCNRWYIYDLTGAELAQTVNNAFTNSNYGDQFSGMIVTYTETEGEPGPEGMPARPVKTVVSITLDDGTPVDITNDTDRIYRIVTNEYCATLPGAVTENMTPVVDINEAPIDNEAIIAVLRAEGKANDGKLALDLTERCVKEPTFTDVPRGEWYFSYVENAAKMGLITGFPDGTFRPEGTLTRAEAATLLYRLAGTPEVTGTASFTDLVNGWYDDAIAWAEETGIVNGFSDGTFHPDEAVTREQFVTMVWRLSGETEATGTLEGFVDADSVQEYARPAFAWAIENGIVNGITSYQWEGVRLAPQDNIKRCEAAKILT